ncbi:MAG TPA: 5'-nucleotidase C-terminal domain-containing protein [Polyangiaceae bacterium]|jgi:5'-nucleotidase
MRLGPIFSRAVSGGLFVWAAVTACMTAATPACQLQAANAGETACPPNADGTPGHCQTTLTLLHTADIHSRLLPYNLLITQVDGNLGLGTIGEQVEVGGAARMAYVINRERAKSNRSLHISGGDVFEGAPIFNFFSGEPEMRVQAALGVDAMTLANHEFDRGAPNVARQIERWADFPVLAANYVFSDPSLPTSNALDTVIHPFTVLNAGGLKVAVIGMGNLSSLTSVFNTPNSFGIKPLNTTEVVQFYVDLLRPMADLIVIDSHLGLEVDQRVITETTGVDIWLGSHNHIVINPPEQITDCSADPQSPGFVWVMPPNYVVDEKTSPPSGTSTQEVTFANGAYTVDDGAAPYELDPANHPYEIHRVCTPRNVILAHSGAFAKYVGRLDLVLSNDPASLPASYDPIDGFEVLSDRYQVFPITADVPEDPVTKELLEPYQEQLQRLSDLTTIAGFSPNGAKRTAPANGDSPLGNLVAASNWLRLGIQTDFSLTNTTGLRQDLLPGPVTIDEAYDIFPFDNTITTMYLSGAEVYQLYDFVARRSASRGCVSQAQIAGSRVRIDCNACNRKEAIDTCLQDSDCPAIDTLGTCNTSAAQLPNGEYPCNYQACAENIYIGFTNTKCSSDADCKDADGNVEPGACSKTDTGAQGVCMTPIDLTNVYELATSNYLAGGGSGFRVLQRNTTQIDSHINQRDAMLDYIRQGKPCGWTDPTQDTTGNVDATGLTKCTTDNDCAAVGGGGFVCACDGSQPQTNGGALTCGTTTCTGGAGHCIMSSCRDQVAQFRSSRCASAPDTTTSTSCQASVNPCDAASEICQIIACVDDKLSAVTDNRVEMIGQ